MPKYAKIGENQYVKYPDEWTDDQVRSELEKRGVLKKKDIRGLAASRKANIEAGGDIPPGVDLSTPPDASYGERIGRNFSEGMQSFGTGLKALAMSQVDPQGNDLKRAGEAMGVVGGPMAAAASPATAGFEKIIRGGPTAQGLAGPEQEEYSRIGGKFVSDILQILATNPRMFEGYTPKTAAPSPVVGNETPAPVQMMEGGKPVDVVPNAPPPPGAGEAIAQKYQATDLGTLDQNISAAKGVSPADEITVGEVPISRTEMRPDGSHSIDLASEDPALLAHEKLHVEAETKGTPHPPEDNAAIAAKEVGPKPEDFIGMETNIRGRPGRILSYDADSDMYNVKDIKTGVEQMQPAENIQKSFGATEKIAPAPKPPAPLPSGPELDVDYGAATGPYTGKTGEIPEGAIEPSKATGVPAQGGTDSGGTLKPPKPLGAPDPPNPATEGGKLRKIFDDAINLRIVQMVTAPITWARNVGMQGFSTLVRAMDTAIGSGLQKGVQAIGGGDAAPVVNSAGALKEMFISAAKNSKIWKEIESMSAEANTLNDTQSLIGRPQFNSETLNKYAQVASAPNRLQEGWFRTGHAVNHLNQVALNKTGRTLSEVLGDGDFMKVFTDADVANAVKEARTVTFSLPGQGKASQWLLQARSIPVVRMFQPFLRFGYNNARWLYTHSPLAAIELGIKPIFSQAARDAWMAGDAATMVRVGEAVTGSAMFMGASTYAAKVMKDGDSLAAFGQRVNISPLNPLSAYLVAGYMFGKWKRSDPAPMFNSEKDFQYLFDAMLNTRGVSSGIVENFVQSARQIIETGGKPAVVAQRMQDFAGRWVAAYARPLGAINEILSSVDPELADMRDPSGHVWDASIAAVPYVNMSLPKRYGTDYAGPVKIQSGAARQLTGLGFEHIGTRVNDEMKLYQVYPKYTAFPGNLPAYNNDYRKIMMEEVDREGLKMVSEDSWAKQSPAMKRQNLQTIATASAKKGKLEVLKTMPPELQKQMIRIDPELRMIFEERKQPVAQ
jgi:hypothetical protein